MEALPLAITRAHPKHRLERESDRAQVLGFVKGYMMALDMALRDSGLSADTRDHMVEKIGELTKVMNDPDIHIEIPKLDEIFKNAIWRTRDNDGPSFGG